MVSPAEIDQEGIRKMETLKMITMIVSVTLLITVCFGVPAFYILSRTLGIAELEVTQAKSDVDNSSTDFADGVL